MNGVRASFGINDVMALRQQVLARSGALRDVRAASEGAQLPSAAQAPGAGFADTLTSALKQVSAVQDHSSAMQVAYERGHLS
jgi:flagellar hook-basal body complex protein FliE